MRVPRPVPRPTVTPAAASPLAVGRAPAHDPAAIEVGLDDPRRADQVRVVVDGPGHPVDVGRLEGRDLAERVVVELAERDDVCASAASSDGGGGRRKWRTRSRTSGPVGVEARGGSRRSRAAADGRLAAQRSSGPAALPTAWLRGW